MKFSFKKFIPHIIVIIGFAITSLAYFNPVLSGKKIKQHDIVQYNGMARQQTNFRNETGTDPYWADNAFGGMPTYQMGAQYPHSYIKKLDRLIRFLPRPADYLFLYFISFYVLLLVLKMDWKLAILGSLAFGFSTYYIIIIEAGHNAKAHAIGYMPLVLSGILLTFRKKYIWGFLLLAVAMALEIVANHFQMTYYLLLLVVVLGIAYLIDAYRKKEISHYFKSIGIMLGAVFLALLLNATSLMATSEYAKYSSRGKSDITITATGKPKKSDGLEFDNITHWSYGKLESFNLFIPRFMGGATVEDLGTDSNFYKELLALGVPPNQAESYAETAPTYWGAQPITSGPAYIGAVIIFLFVLALFLVNGRLKWWIVSGSILVLFLSWGHNLAFFTRFFVDYIPLYDKFRAVSSIQVILELCVPIFGIVGFSKFLSSSITEENKIKALKYSTAIVGGLALIFLLFKSTLFNFVSPGDSDMMQSAGPKIVRALKDDRKALFTADTLRSLILVLLVAAGCWFYLKGKLKQNLLLIGLGVLIVFDLVVIDRNYVNNENFISPREFSQTFIANNADKEILKDKDHYRVYDLTRSPFGSARSSYFHNSLGGYHAAKLGRIDDLYDFYLTKGDVGVLNMLNVKYIINEDKDGIITQTNPYVNGNAWFVEKVKFVDTADDEILGLKGLDTKKETLINTKFAELINKKSFTVDSLSSVKLISQQPNHLVYESNNTSEGMVVFSEIYYKDGWQAYLDGNPVEYVQANYVLRAMIVPSGQHKIEFKFDPQVVRTGSSITLASSILFILLILGALFFEYKKRKEPQVDEDS